jgi:NAD(P)-dependent dehydrogenase (short-subunit alcohol dehydrogenase family)
MTKTICPDLFGSNIFVRILKYKIMKKVVLLTGASAGIGEATAILLQVAGYTVYAAARRVDRMKHLKKEGIQILKLDVSEEESMQTAVSTILQREGQIDVLINNAGYGSYGAMEDVPIEEARYQFEVNIFGLARLTQLVLPHMRSRRQGKIINVSSIGGSFGEPHGVWYHASKYAVEGLSDSLRMELKQFNIDVVIIKPGAINTEWMGIARDNLLQVSKNTAYAGLAQKHAEVYSKLNGKGSHPNVIAKAILKACKARKPKTRYIVGDKACLIMGMRKILSDKMFDRMMLSQLK